MVRRTVRWNQRAPGGGAGTSYGPGVSGPSNDTAKPNQTTYGGGSSDQNAPHYEAVNADPYKPSGYSMWGPTNGVTQGWSAPSAGAVAQTRAAQTPAAPQTQGIFRSPGMAETLATGEIPGLRQKGYREQLYESGNQGLNQAYDRQLQRRQTDLENRMSAAGVFGSGATAQAMGDLQADLGAAQARDMEGLAGQADEGRLGRLGLAGSLAGQGQRLWYQREHGALDDQMNLANNMSGIFSGYAMKGADEQRQIREDVINNIIAQGGIDHQQAEQQADELMRSLGIFTTAMGRNSTGRGAAPPPPVVPEYPDMSTYNPSLQA